MERALQNVVVATCRDRRGTTDDDGAIVCPEKTYDRHLKAMLAQMRAHLALFPTMQSTCKFTDNHRNHLHHPNKHHCCFKRPVKITNICQMLTFLRKNAHSGPFWGTHQSFLRQERGRRNRGKRNTRRAVGSESMENVESGGSRPPRRWIGTLET